MLFTSEEKSRETEQAHHQKSGENVFVSLRKVHAAEHCKPSGGLKTWMVKGGCIFG